MTNDRYIRWDVLAAKRNAYWLGFAGGVMVRGMEREPNNASSNSVTDSYIHFRTNNFEKGTLLPPSYR